MPTESQLRDVQLHARIRQLVDEGWLPIVLPDMIEAHYGSNSKCYACDQPVTDGQIEYDAGDPRDRSALLRLHMGCFVLWQIECVRRIRNQQRDHRIDQRGPPEGYALMSRSS